MATNMRMTTRIIIRDLIVVGRYGVSDRERTAPQPLKIDIWATVSNTNAGISDDISQTLNWSELRQLIIDTIENNSFKLIERLGQEISDLILEDKKITYLKLRLCKLQAFKNGIPSIEIECSNEIGVT
jgi:dihydroneopterin aldolase